MSIDDVCVEVGRFKAICCEDVFTAAAKKAAAKKAGRKEVNPKHLSEQKQKELEEERKKEWNGIKLMNSEATTVHKGEAAKRVIEDLVWILFDCRILDSRYVDTSDDGTMDGKLS